MHKQESHFPHGRARALTISELLVVLAVLVALAVLVGPKALQPVRSRIHKASCASQLKSLGVAFHLYAGLHGRLLPAELIESHAWQTNFDETLVGAWKLLSNEVTASRLLVCPSDARFAAVNFDSLARSNLSYFMSIDATLAAPHLLLAGDRNLSSGGVKVDAGLLSVHPDRALGTTKELHGGSAAFLFVDGSVRRFDPASDTHPDFTTATNRIAVP